MKTRLQVAFVLLTWLLIATFVLSPDRTGIALAATLTLSTCDASELVAVMEMANANGEADTIELKAGCTYLFTEVNNSDFGFNALPTVTTNITIHGNDSTLARSNASGTPEFRFFRVNGGASLSLDHLLLSGGSLNHIGGAISNFGALNVADSIFSNNHSALGGAIYNEENLFLSHSTFRLNTAQQGAGLYNEGIADVTKSTFAENQASESGGGIYNFRFISVSDSTFFKNSALNGGAVFNNHLNATIQNSTFSENMAQNSGGALYNLTPEPDLVGLVNATNLTLANNIADSDNNGSGDGGGIYDTNGAVLNISNTILSGNRDNGGEAPDCAGSLNSEGYNLIQNTSSCIISGDTTGNRYAVDPLLGPLASNGGATETMTLQPDSPAIDAGNPAPPGSTDTACQPTDQRGVARPQDGNGDGVIRCDIGAYELEGTVSPTPTPTPSVFTVVLDIKPGSSTNPINLKSKGVIPVAILSSASFDARAIDFKTICFGDAQDPSQRDCSEAHSIAHWQDVNGDGRIDMVLHFEMQQTGIDPGDTQACVSGKTLNGESVQGCDAINV